MEIKNKKPVNPEWVKLEGKWLHVAIVREKLYINGQEIGWLDYKPTPPKEKEHEFGKSVSDDMAYWLKVDQKNRITPTEAEKEWGVRLRDNKITKKIIDSQEWQEHCKKLSTPTDSWEERY